MLFAGSEQLPAFLAEELGRADPGLSPFEALLVALAEVGKVLGERVALHAAQRHEVIAQSPELQERGRTKFAAVAHALTAALQERGMDSSGAALYADVGVAIFRNGFDRWLRSPDGTELAACIREVGTELADAVTVR